MASISDSNVNKLTFFIFYEELKRPEHYPSLKCVILVLSSIAPPPPPPTPNPTFLKEGDKISKKVGKVGAEYQNRLAEETKRRSDEGER